MTFNEFVSYYGLSRSEGLVLRYLTDAYRTLRHTIPEGNRTEELEDIIEWLGELVRQTDSSLLDEWEDLVNPTDAVLAQTDIAPPARPITANERAFTVMIRNAMFHRVELASRDEWEALGDLEARVAELTEPPQKVAHGRRRRGTTRSAPTTTTTTPSRPTRVRARPRCSRSSGRRPSGGCARSSSTPTTTRTGASRPSSTSRRATRPALRSSR